MHRRHFLRASAGAAGCAAFGSLVTGQQRFAAALDASSEPTAADYSLAEGLTYLNHGSVGTCPKVVQAAHEGYLRTCESNPWLYMWGGVWDEALASTRKRAAEFLKCREDEIALNRNTTDGFSLLAAGLSLQKGDEVLFSNFNHSGASVSWEHHAAERGYVVRHFDLPFAAAAEMTEAEVVAAHVRAIRPGTVVLVMPHMDNTVGLRTPLKQIAAAAREAGVRYVFADGAQTAGMVPVSMADLGVDAYCMSPHKWIQAPKGTGIMFLSRKLQPHVRPHSVTWGQRRWQDQGARIFEDYGTRDMPAVLALGDALAFQQKHFEASIRQRQKLWKHAFDRVAAEKTLRWRSPASYALGGSLFAVEVVGADAGVVGERLWKKHRITVRAFRSKELNHLRVSPNAANTAADLDRLFAALA